MGASFLDIRFLGALCLLAVLRIGWPKRSYAAWGAICSGVVIGFAAPKTLIAICAITLCLIIPLQALNRRARMAAGPGQERKKTFMLVGIAAMVAILILFKVFRHFTVPGLAGPWLKTHVLALIGFSYFVFRAIDYLHIQLILDSQRIPFWNALFYFLFPPTITSGPIHKYQDFQKQLENPESLTPQLVLRAGYRMTRGFFRKTVVAVILDGWVQRLLGTTSSTAYSSILILALLFLFFYFDFAGYSDIAIGFGLLLGIRVPENFRKPFLATSIAEFWRNWHITLVDWFRDHVFIPLGGMRASRLNGAALALLIMILCGLWHGLTLPMIVWGVWHGMNMFLEALLGIRPVSPGRRVGAVYWLRVLGTNARAALGCALFLPTTDAIMKVLAGFGHWRL